MSVRTIRCVKCGVKIEVDERSKRTLCYTCHIKAINENIRQLQTKRGKYFERWKQQVKAKLNSLTVK